MHAPDCAVKHTQRWLERSVEGCAAARADDEAVRSRHPRAHGPGRLEPAGRRELDFGTALAHAALARAFGGGVRCGPRG